MNKITLPKDQPVVRKENLVGAEMDNEIVMLDIERGEYFGMGGVGARVWELLAEPMTEDGLVSQLIAEYDVTEEVCRADIHKLLSELLELEIIRNA